MGGGCFRSFYLSFHTLIVPTSQAKKIYESSANYQGRAWYTTIQLFWLYIEGLTEEMIAEGQVWAWTPLLTGPPGHSHSNTSKGMFCINSDLKCNRTQNSWIFFPSRVKPWRSLWQGSAESFFLGCWFSLQSVDFMSENGLRSGNLARDPDSWFFFFFQLCGLSNWSSNLSSGMLCSVNHLWGWWWVGQALAASDCAAPYDVCIYLASDG